MELDRAGLASFLRRRREALQPEDVGLLRGARRRTSGLRREEVAMLCHMSTDYYSRIEQERGPQPSPQMVAAMAQGLHLTLDERDYLFRLAGHTPPLREPGGDHISPGLLRIFDRLDDTPAEIVTELGETLRQTRLGVALTGDLTVYSGLARSIIYRWFTDPETRARYAPADHERLGRFFSSGLRSIVAMRGSTSRAAQIADALLDVSPEFVAMWDRHEVGINLEETKHFLHPALGEIAVNCQPLVDRDQSHLLLVYTALPGTESYDRLQLLGAVEPVG